MPIRKNDYNIVGAGRRKAWRKHNNATLDGMSTFFEHGEGNTSHNHEFTFARLEEIALATHNFSETCMIGQGGFGKVYKVHNPFDNFRIFFQNFV
jgi:hypothetical protein